MSAMRDCPKCSAQVGGVTCQRCGYSEVKKTNTGEHDPDWWRCCDTDTAGNRCSKAGALSDSTFGKGPWFCRQHYPSFRERSAVKTAPPGGFVALQRALRLVTMREPGEDG
jgi:predicted nucleic-acid-binding Zn-ribbon protein